MCQNIVDLHYVNEDVIKNWCNEDQADLEQEMFNNKEIVAYVSSDLTQEVDDNSLEFRSLET